MRAGEMAQQGPLGSETQRLWKNTNVALCAVTPALRGQRHEGDWGLLSGNLAPGSVREPVSRIRR